MDTQRFDRRRSCADQISHRLVAFAWNPNRGQLTRAKKSRQRNRIATVRLHPVAGLSRYQRRRSDCALVTK
jgi:hypothetical protein